MKKIKNVKPIGNDRYCSGAGELAIIVFIFTSAFLHVRTIFASGRVIWGYFHTNPDKSKDAAFFIWLGLSANSNPPTCETILYKLYSFTRHFCNGFEVSVVFSKLSGSVWHSLNTCNVLSF